MTYAESLTQSYTIADIGKVIDCLAADLDMNAQSTKLLTRDQVKSYAADVKAMAQSGYLLEANIVLYDSSGEPVRAAKYEVSTDGSLLKMQRPGNNLWPQMPGGELLLDLSLAFEQPVHRRIQIIFIGAAHAELLGECARMPPAGGGELGMRSEHAGGDECQDAIAFRAWPRADE